MQDFEKLGQFYLGREYDLSSKKGDPNALVLYDAKDLVTHAVCVGMTGSGKTGLCLGLIEEAAIDGVPSIVIDPKGDLSNLLLTFPTLRPEDFRPWINEDDARRKGVSPDEYAAAQAEMWAKGLASWGQSGERIAKLRAAAEFRVYTPGSNAGIPVSVLKSLSAPPAALVEDGELFRERVSSTATSLLGLMGIAADPLSSREHILISNLLSRSWSDGADMDLSALITQIQNPPMQRLGVMELEGFFPASERFGLAMRLNNLLASPGFASWMEGEALDIGAMLCGEGGKPRVAIFSIAHLSDAERMFFVSMLFNQLLAWTRQQSGTTSLRALVYMDEIAGYFPPVANPPSKGPMLTLMKQARAFGVGMVFATQNPVDIDYKGLSNAGTWLIGRLQTERDKMRVLDGLEGAAAQSSSGFDRAWADRTLSALGPRQFLMNNVHEDGPVVFETRWCLSYLRGPLTRQQIKVLMDPVKAGGAGAGGVASGGTGLRPVQAVASDSPSTTASFAPATSVSMRVAGQHQPTAGATKASATNAGSSRPVLPPEIPQFFLPTRESGPLTYAPSLFATARVLYRETKLGVDVEESVTMLVPMSDGAVTVDWDHAEETDLVEGDLEREPSGDAAAFAPLPPEASRAKSYESWKRAFADAVFRNHALELSSCPGLKMVSAPGETEEAFKARVAHALREKRDEQAEKLRTKYTPKLAALQERLRKAEQQVAVQKEQASGAKWGAALSAGAAILGSFLGRKVASAGNIGRATTAARGVGRTMKESSDVGRAEETVEAVKRQATDLQAQFDADLATVSEETDALGAQIETVSLRPKKTNISVRTVVLAWRAG
ncbi:MAG: ATP-binding protein [Phycisphaerales bacterium]